MASHCHLRLSLGSWEDSFYTSVNFRDRENQHGNYSIGMGMQTEGLYRGQLDTQEVWVRVTVELFPCINELSSDLFQFFKKGQNFRPKFQTENLKNKRSALFIMLTCPCNLDHPKTTLLYSKTIRGLSKRITSFCGYQLELLK